MADPNDLMRELLETVATGYDQVRPGAGECVREMIKKDYPQSPEATGEQQEETVWLQNQSAR